MQFDMNRTWSQAIALVKANFQLLAILAGVFLLLPTVVMYLAIPELMQVFALMRDPVAMDALMAAILPRLLAFGLPALILQLIGQMAMVAMMGGDRPTVGEAIKLGARAVPSVIGAAIVFIAGLFAAAVAIGLALTLVIVVLGLIGAALGMTADSGAGLVAVIGAAIYVLAFGLELYVMVRFMMTLPIIVLEREYNPVKALKRSWRITGPRAWAILGFIVLLGIAYFVIVTLLLIVFGAVGFLAGFDSATGAAGTGSVFGFALFICVIGSLVAMLATGILVSMHQQLAGGRETPELEFDA